VARHVQHDYATLVRRLIELSVEHLYALCSAGPAKYVDESVLEREVGGELALIVQLALDLSPTIARHVIFLYSLQSH
jgi:hypothetical protein